MSHFDSFTHFAKNTLILSQEEMRRLGEQQVQTQHLLLGILRQPKSTGGAVLRDFGVTYENAFRIAETLKDAERSKGARILGNDPKTGKQVSVRLGKFGPMVQLGTVDDEEKPTFARLSPDQQLNTITYEEAMDLFQLPKNIGTYKEQELLVNNGRFGPYVKFGDKFVSLPKGTDPLSVELEDAIVLIKEKKGEES
jgi:topoisomerase IA-like protein